MVTLPLQDQPVSFRDFMAYCLYDSRRGYYRRGRPVIGAQGDYITSPHLHRFFAQTLTSALVSFYETLGRPDQFTVVELGAGEGLLRRQLITSLSTIRPQLRERVDYREVEIDRGKWPGPFQGVVLSNEFFDALPVHRIRVVQGEPREIFVVQREGRWVEVIGDLTDPRIPDYLEVAFGDLTEGSVYEVNLEMLAVLSQVRARLLRGFLVTIDYGYDRERYRVRDRPEGTLLCYHRHQVLDEPFRRIGEQDITSHISFEVLRNRGAEWGWHNQPLVSQRTFMLKWGLERLLAIEEAEGLFNSARLAERLGLKHLLEPGGISDRLQVQVQELGI